MSERKTNIPRKLAALEKMTSGELRAKYRELFGEESRSGNRQWLFRRCAWRLQELVHGRGSRGRRTGPARRCPAQACGLEHACRYTQFHCEFRHPASSYLKWLAQTGRWGQSVTKRRSIDH